MEGDSVPTETVHLRVGIDGPPTPNPTRLRSRHQLPQGLFGDTQLHPQ